MAAIVGLHLRGREDGRKAKKRKRSRSKNKPMESLRSRLIVNLLWCLAFLLFVLPAVSSLTVEGLKGGSITLPCNSSNGEDLTTLLTFGSKNAYGLNQDEHFRDRVHKSGSCDLTLEDLKTTDAGKYLADVYDNNGLISSNTFDVHVKVSLTGRTGEELMFVLPHEAKNVTHFTDPDWTEVWTRGQGVLTDRLTDNNSRLTIKHFSSSDAGTYRVLNSSGGILVTVTITESSTSSKDKHEDEPHDSEQVPVWVWIGIGVVVLVVLVGLAVAVFKIHPRLKRNKKPDSYQGVSMKEPVQGPRSPNNSNGTQFAFSANRSAEDPANISFLTQSVD